MPQPDAKSPESGVLQRLAHGEPLLSLGIRNARTAEIVRMAKTAGFGLVWIDLEHSSISIDCAVQIIASAADLELEAWVRVPERDYGVIGRLLDGGATGIVAPRVETEEEARRVVNAARFPPRGQRSQTALLPQAKYRRMSAAELMRCADLATTVHILIESAEGVRNSDAIAAIDGVDTLHVGMNDLSVDLGHVDHLRHADVLDACKRVIAAARGCGSNQRDLLPALPHRLQRDRRRAQFVCGAQRSAMGLPVGPDGFRHAGWALRGGLEARCPPSRRRTRQTGCARRGT